MSDVDWGLLGGLAEGLKSGVTSYYKTKEDAEEKALKRRLIKIQEAEAAAKIAESTGIIPKGMFSEDIEQMYYGKKSEDKPSGLLGESTEGLVQPAGPGEKIPGFLTKRQKDLQKIAETKSLDFFDKGKKVVVKGDQLVLEDISTPEQKVEKLQEKQKKEAEAKKAIAEARIAENKLGEIGAEVPFKKLPKEKQIIVENLSKTQSTMIPIKSQLQELASQIEDPARSDSDKLAIAQEQLKLLNSTLGADAVGAEEVKRIAAFLDPWPNWVKKTPGADLKGFLRQVRASEDRVGKTIQNLESKINEAYGKAPKLVQPPQAQVSGMPEAEKQAALEFIAKNPNSPQAIAIRKTLGMKDK